MHTIGKRDIIMFKFFKRTKNEPVAQVMAEPISKYAETKELFRAMNRDPEIRALYDVIRQPQVRGAFRAEETLLANYFTSYYNYIDANGNYAIYIYYAVTNRPTLRIVTPRETRDVVLDSYTFAHRLLIQRVEQIEKRLRKLSEVARREPPSSLRKPICRN